MADSIHISTPKFLGGQIPAHSVLASAPGPLVRAGDFLRLNASSTDASATLHLAGRLLTLDRGVVPFDEDMIITGAGDQAPVTIPLADGWIIGLIVFVSAGTITDGEVVASVEVVQGSGSGLTRVMSLASGEISNTRTLGLGAYLIRGAGSAAAAPTIVTALQGNPAAGAEFSITVTAGQTWEIQAVQVTLATSATAANREVTLVVDDGTDAYLRVGPTVTQTASLTRLYSFAEYGTAYSTPDSNTRIVSLPRVIVAGGYRIRSLTTGIQVGDQFTSPIINYVQL